MNNATNVRAAVPNDFEGIRRVVEAAFGQSAEADLIEALRASADPFLELVAERSGELVGQIAFSPVVIEPAADSGADVPEGLMALAPMAVRPDCQRSGIGRALVIEGLEACRSRGVGAVFVLGHPAYYPRFGFEPLAPRGLRFAFDAPPEACLALELRPDALSGLQGTVRFHEAFRGD